MTGDIGVFAVVIGAFQENLAVLEHLKQFVNLYRVQFADFINEQDTAMCLGNSTRFRLGDAGHAQRAGTLVNRIMNRTDQRVGDPPLIKASRSGIQLYKLGAGTKRAVGVLFGFFQDQPGRGSLANTGGTVKNHMLRIGAAQGGAQRFQAVFLADNFLE